MDGLRSHLHYRLLSSLPPEDSEGIYLLVQISHIYLDLQTSGGLTDHQSEQILGRDSREHLPALRGLLDQSAIHDLIGGGGTVRGQRIEANGIVHQQVAGSCQKVRSKRSLASAAKYRRNVREIVSQSSAYQLVCLCQEIITLLLMYHPDPARFMLLLGTQDVLGSRIIPEFSNPTNNTLLEQRKYSYTEASGDLFCRPFGECEPCPKDEVSQNMALQSFAKGYLTAIHATTFKRDQPFCRPFGNRRLVHCIPKGQADPQDPYASEIEVDIPTRRQESGSATHSQKESPVLVGGSSRVIDMGSVQLGEVPAWEACGKVLAIERAGYWEFVVS